jgi:hypothetical protein
MQPVYVVLPTKQSVEDFERRVGHLFNNDDNAFLQALLTNLTEFLEEWDQVGDVNVMMEEVINICYSEDASYYTGQNMVLIREAARKFMKEYMAHIERHALPNHGMLYYIFHGLLADSNVVLISTFKGEG